MRLRRRTPRHERAHRLLNIAAELSDLRYANMRYRRALEEIAALPAPQLQTRTWREIAIEALAASREETHGD